MATPGCLGNRLARAVVPTRNHALLFPCRHPRPKDWVRSITTTTVRRSGGVTFGKDNDEIIAPYLQRATKTSRSGTKKRIEVTPLSAIEEYDIGGFVDRSTPTTGPSHSLPQTLDGDSIDPEAPKRGRRSTKREDVKRGTVRRRQGDDLKPDPAMISIEEVALFEQRQTQNRKRVEEEDGRQTAKAGAVGDRRQSRKKTSDDRDVHADTSQLRWISRVREHEGDPRPPRVSRPLERKRVEDIESWAAQKNALKEKFEDGWNPRKKLSPDAMEGVRSLHEQDPEKYSTELLAQQFKMSPEAIRRILKSKWSAQQSPEKMQERRERWAKRHDRIWDAKAEIGQRPPRRKDKEVEDPDQFERDLERRSILGEL